MLCCSWWWWMWAARRLTASPRWAAARTLFRRIQSAAFTGINDSGKLLRNFEILIAVFLRGPLWDYVVPCLWSVDKKGTGTESTWHQVSYYISQLQFVKLGFLKNGAKRVKFLPQIDNVINCSNQLFVEVRSTNSWSLQCYIHKYDDQRHVWSSLFLDVFLASSDFTIFFKNVFPSLSYVLVLKSTRAGPCSLLGRGIATMSPSTGNVSVNRWRPGLSRNICINSWNDKDLFSFFAKVYEENHPSFSEKRNCQGKSVLKNIHFCPQPYLSFVKQIFRCLNQAFSCKMRNYEKIILVSVFNRNFRGTWR